MVARTRPPEPRWQIAPVDEAGRRLLIDALGIAPLTAQALINRGLGDPTAAAVFLTPSLERLSDPFALVDMDRAVDRLARAVRDDTPIAIYGDYDADGVTATAILGRGLRRAGGRVDFYIPDRRTEGYGLHAAAVAALAAQGAGVLVAVDCGITGTAAADVARSAGLDLIILDHHEPVGPLPHALAVVDPKRQAAFAGADYCAAGLAYQACRGLYAAVPDELIALAALGTVADAVNLTGDNRILVAHGLERLARPSIPGLDALAAVAGVRAPLRVRDLSHALAPRLNAAGRLAHAGAALRLLVTDDATEAQQLAVTLDRLNQERRALCDAVLAEAVAEVEREGLDREPAIVLAREGWHPGVIGIVASQLVERYYRPTVLIALEDAVGRGSARSIRPLHLVETLRAVAGHLDAYGGHAMAAGLAIAAQAVPRFTEAFVREARARLRAEDLYPVTRVDAEASLEVLTPALARELERLAPFGNGNPEPVFLTRGLRALGTRLVGDGTHLRLVVSDGARTAEAIAFRGGDRAELLAFTQARIDLAYTVEVDRWRDDERVQLVVADLQTPGVDLTTVAADTVQVLDRLFERAQDYLGGRLGDIEQAASFHTKVVGVTFDGRQAILPAVRAGEPLRLVRDPQNPRDPHAIKVLLGDGRQLGFLGAGLAARLAPSMDAGVRYTASATALTGGGDRAWGLNIYLEREAPWAGEGLDPEDIRTRLGAGPDFVARCASSLYRGRAPTAAQREVAKIMLAGGRAVARFGPGRGLLPAVLMAAAALHARGARLVAVVFPRAGVVEAWHDLAGAWLREAGIRPGAAHGGLGASAAGRLRGALDRGALDLLFASAVWTERHAPPADAVIVVLDALSTDHDVSLWDDRYGDAVRLIAGPMPEDLADRGRRRLGLDGIVADSRTRDHLRIVDRRGQPVLEIVPPAGGARPEKTLVVAATPEESVAVARRLRERHPDAAARIAYYHAGLPAALRRVLEDLFAAGRLTTLVAGSHVVDPAAPADIARVIAAGLRPDRLLTADSLAVAGLGRRSALIELSYGPEAIAVSQTGVDARWPSRDTLVRCYRGLKAVSGGGPWTWPDDASADRPEFGLGGQAFAASLEVLVEAGIVTREAAEGSSTRYALVETGGRVDLRRSLRHLEGERERAGWEDLKQWATGPAARILGDLARA